MKIIVMNYFESVSKNPALHGKKRPSFVWTIREKNDYTRQKCPYLYMRK